MWSVKAAVSSQWGRGDAIRGQLVLQFGNDAEAADTMQMKLQDLIDASQDLTPVEQIQLLNALTQSLYRLQINKQREAMSPDSVHAFNRTPPVTDLSSFIADFWPENESADDLNDFIYQQRQADYSADL